MSTLLQAHRQWATRPQDQRFETLDALAESVNNRRTRSRSVDVDGSAVTAKIAEGTIVLNRGFNSVEPSHWSFGQLSGWLKAPAAYLRTLPPELAVSCLNNGLQAQAKEIGSLKFMAVTEDDKPINTLQAVTSTTYGRIWDADVVAGAKRLVERSGGRFYNPKAYGHRDGATPDGFKTLDSSVKKPSGLYASDRDCFLFMIDGGSILDVGPRAQLNRGFILWNSEVGSRTFGLMTFLFNTCCGNHMIFGAKEVNQLIIRHTANGPARFDSEATPALLAYCNESARPLEAQVRKAQETLIAPVRATKPEELFVQVNDFAGKYAKFTKGEIRSGIDFAKAEEGDCRTVWQLVQGLTAYARGFDWIDARVDLESRAGRLMQAVSLN